MLIRKMSLNTIEKVKDFSNIVCKYDSTIDIQEGRYVIDGKSILGIFSLNLFNPLEIRIDFANEDEEKRLTSEIERFFID